MSSIISYPLAKGSTALIHPFQNCNGAGVPKYQVASRLPINQFTVLPSSFLMPPPPSGQPCVCCMEFGD